MLCLKTTGSSSDPSGSNTRAQGRRGRAYRTPCPTEGPVRPATPTLQSSFELWHFRRRHALHDLLMVRQAQRDMSKWPWPEEAFHVGSRCASGGSGSDRAGVGAIPARRAVSPGLQEQLGEVCRGGSLRWDVVERVVPVAELVPAAQALARQIA